MAAAKLCVCGGSCSAFGGVVLNELCFAFRKISCPSLMLWDPAGTPAPVMELVGCEAGPGGAHLIETDH